jgi:hypothetical protein
MFVVSNLSNNALKLSDGKMLAAGDSRKLKKIDDLEAKYVSRNWISVIEEEKKDSGKPNEGGK